MDIQDLARLLAKVIADQALRQVAAKKTLKTVSSR